MCIYVSTFVLHKQVCNTYTIKPCTQSIALTTYLNLATHNDQNQVALYLKHFKILFNIRLSVEVRKMIEPCFQNGVDDLYLLISRCPFGVGIVRLFSHSTTIYHQMAACSIVLLHFRMICRDFQGMFHADIFRFSQDYRRSSRPRM